ELAERVDTSTRIDFEHLQLVAGVDVSVKQNISRAAIVVLRFPSMEIVESVTAQMPTPFPYITGLLSFREGAVILEAHQKLSLKPDAYIFDGMGIAHPRRLGIAAHIGLWLDRPTVGCGKTHLIGYHKDLGLERGSRELLIQHTNGRDEVIGHILRTRDGIKPVYVSPGHHATIDTASELVMRCVTRY